MWTLAEVLKSQVDRTVKYIYTEDGKFQRFLEVTRLRKGDGKDILVMPTQTSCKLGCQFCHLTGLDAPVENLDARTIADLVSKIIQDIPDKEPTLLVSFMGSGEPLMNIDEVVDAADVLMIHQDANSSYCYQTVRFAVASLIPSTRRMDAFTNYVKDSGLNFKFHWSLHSAINLDRQKVMPAAVSPEIGVDLVHAYIRKTNNSAEAHYTLIDGVNDREEDIRALARLLHRSPITVKILRLSERKGEPLARSPRVDEFRSRLQDLHIKTEYYEPPGYDIGSACGQFLTKYYAPKVRLPIATSQSLARR